MAEIQNTSFESTFNAIDNILRHDDGCSTALDYVEQSSWVLFLKYFDDLEKTREQQAALEDKTYERVIQGEYQWHQWAMPQDASGKYDSKRALVGDDLIEFVNSKLFPYLKNFTQKYAPDTLEFKVGVIYTHIKNKISSGYNLRDLVERIDELRFLNPQYRNDVIPGNIHPYALTLPAQYVYSYRRNRDRIASHDRELYAVRDEVQPGESKEDSQPHLAPAVIKPIDEAPVSRRRSVSIAYNDSPRPASYPPANYSGHAGSDYRQVPAARARQEKGTTTQVPVPVKRKSYVVNPSQQY